jgi:hypothetical protein
MLNWVVYIIIQIALILLQEIWQQNDFLGTKEAFLQSQEISGSLEFLQVALMLMVIAPTAFKGLGKGLQAYTHGFGIQLKKSHGLCFLHTEHLLPIIICWA